MKNVARFLKQCAVVVILIGLVGVLASGIIGIVNSFTNTAEASTSRTVIIYFHDNEIVVENATITRYSSGFIGIHAPDGTTYSTNEINVLMIDKP